MPWPTWKTRPALLPLRVRLAAPGPVTVTLRGRVRAPPVSLMVPRLRPGSNWMVSLLAACATASRRLRKLSAGVVSSARVLTIKTAGARRSSRASTRSTKRRPGGRCPRQAACRTPPDFRLIAFNQPRQENRAIKIPLLNNFDSAPSTNRDKRTEPSGYFFTTTLPAMEEFPSYARAEGEHAIRRMQERKVSEDEVLDVLRNPTQRGYRRSLSDFAIGSTPPLTTGST